MSVESYSTLDESSLRALLDGTMDLDERRLIRSAIRELRRREIQDMEAALASKRFRPTRVKPQEDKENQHRSESSCSLDILSQKLQGIKDIDELTKMLRSACDYEERKVIRAAIRQIREDQQQVERCKGPGSVDSQSGVGAQQDSERDSVGERGHIQQTPQQGPEEHKTASSSGMVLVFDSLVKDEGPLLIQSQREAPDPHPLPGPRHRSDSTSSDRSTSSVHSYRSRLDSGASERSQGTSQRGRLDSGASERSQGTSQRGQLDSGASECSQGTPQRGRLDSGASERTQRGRLDSGASDQSGGSLRQRLDSDRSDSSPRVRLGSLERSASVCSDDRGPTQEPVTNGSAHSTDSETETKYKDQTDGAVFSREGPKLTNCSVKGKTEFLTQKIAISNSLTNGKPKDAVLEHFTRTNSVRDRMRKFTESTQNSAPAVKSAPLRNGRNGTSSKINALLNPMAAPNTNSSSTSGDKTAPLSQRGPGGVTSADQSQGSEGGTEPAAEKDAPGLSVSEEEGHTAGEQDADMKTFLTIEIKDGRTTGTSATGGPIRDMGPRVTANTLGQRAELTLGLRATPFKISSSGFTSAPTIKMETEPCVASEPVFSAPVQVGCPAPNILNGSPSQTTAVERPGKLTAEQLAAIEDEELLDKMLDESKDFEERRLIRAAMRDLRKRKRDQREKERESRLQELRQQRDQRAPRPGPGSGAGTGAGEVVMRKVEKSADGSTLSQVTKTDRFAQSDDGSRSTRSTVVEASYVQKTDRGTIQSKSFSYSSSSSSSTSTSSTTAKKVGSVFDREDDSSSRGAAERRQTEKRKELMRAQTMPKSTMQARKAMIDRLEPGGSSGSPAIAKINRVQRSTSFGVPNANSIKQMLLDWCRAKTRSYEHVDIQNFSSSWSNGMAFCALVHHFFPEAFDYSALSPSNRKHNFEVAFSTAEKMVDCPQLLDVEDMVKMREPDWKCVYTYLQEFYRGLVTKGLVKTRNNS